MIIWIYKTLSPDLRCWNSYFSHIYVHTHTYGHTHTYIRTYICAYIHTSVGTRVNVLSSYLCWHINVGLIANGSFWNSCISRVFYWICVIFIVFRCVSFIVLHELMCIFTMEIFFVANYSTRINLSFIWRRKVLGIWFYMWTRTGLCPCM